MALFLALSPLLGYVLLLSFFQHPARGIRGPLVPFLGGVVVSIPSLIVTWSILSRIPYAMGFGNLLAWSWFRYLGLPGTFALIVPTIILATRKATRRSQLREIAAWIAGVATAYGISWALTPDPGFDAFRVFYIPLCWMAFLFSAPWALNRAFYEDGWKRVLFFVLAFALSTLLTLPMILYAAGYLLPAWLIVVFLFVTSLSAVFFHSRGKIV